MAHGLRKPNLPRADQPEIISECVGYRSSPIPSPEVGPSGAFCMSAGSPRIGAAHEWLRLSFQIPERQDVVYRTVGPFRAALDVYTPRDKLLRPRSTARRPAILAIHGGSWSGGSKHLFRSHPRNETVLRLTQAGYVVIAVDYRLARPGLPGWPEALDDVREAVRWIKGHAAGIPELTPIESLPWVNLLTRIWRLSPRHATRSGR